MEAECRLQVYGRPRSVGVVRCAECGFDWDQRPSAAIAVVGEAPERISYLLMKAEQVLRSRPAPTTWSALEYAVHLGDSLGWYAERLERIHSEERPRFSPFDWDAAWPASPSKNAWTFQWLGNWFEKSK